jgi:hypothetical protein
LPPLAQVEDVKRVAGIAEADDARDGAIMAALLVASDLVRQRLGRGFGSGAQTQRFFQVAAGSTLRLPDSVSSISSVIVDGGTASWEMAGPDRVRLIDAYDSYARLGYVASWRRRPVYREVVVSYVASGQPSAAIVEATAHIAADILAPAPAAVGASGTGSDVGVKSAKIGSFNYTLEESAAAGSEHAQQAETLLSWQRPTVRATVV